MVGFLSGGIAVSSFVAGLFFLRFWKSTRDRFFLFFAISFWIEGLNRTLLWLAGPPSTERIPVYYLIRLAAFLLILLAIFDKNRSKDSV